MATATATREATISQSLVDSYNSVFGADGFLAEWNVERDEEIKLLGLSTISGVDMLFLGDPGVGKTWAIELLLRCITGAELFDILLTKEMSADEVLGPRSLPALKDGRIERIMHGYLATAHFAYLDEYFKASPPLVNSLLDIQAKRQLKVGGQVIDVSQLLAIFASSNELPDREDLQAIRDRIGITKYVHPVRTSDGRRAVTDLQLDFQASGVSDVPEIALDEIHGIKAEVQQIVVPPSIRETADKAQGMWAEKGHAPSQRRMGQMWKVAKSHAWAHGRTEVTTEDLLPWQHMAWNHPDHYESALEVVLEFASVFTRKAQRAKQALEPVLRELDEVKAKIDQAGGEPQEEHLEEAFKAMQKLRKMRREVNANIDEGERMGHDVSELNGVLTEIQNAEDWIEKALAD